MGPAADQRAKRDKSRDTAAAALAEAMAPLYQARARFFGQTLVAHSDSLAAGEVVWAVPGHKQGFTAASLVRADPKFQSFGTPSEESLRHMFALTERHAATMKGKTRA